MGGTSDADERVSAWRALLRAHSVVLKAIDADLAAADLRAARVAGHELTFAGWQRVDSPSAKGYLADVVVASDEGAERRRKVVREFGVVERAQRGEGGLESGGLDLEEGLGPAEAIATIRAASGISSPGRWSG